MKRTPVGAKVVHHWWNVGPRWVLCISLVVICSLFAQEKSTKSLSCEGCSTKQIVYKTVGDDDLKLHVFEPDKRDGGQAVPAILFFHGAGGYPNDFYPQCKYLASRGMVAIAVDYLLTHDRATQRATLGGCFSSPHQLLENAKSAIRWARTHAPELRIDPNRIASAGGSQGGYIAAATAVIRGMEEPNEDLETSSSPNLMVLFNPGVIQICNVYFDELNVTQQVRPGLPPTIILQGTADRNTRFATVKHFSERMKQAGNVCELAVWEDEGHGFHRRKPELYEQTLRAIDAFLRKLGYLESATPDSIPAHPARPVLQLSKKAPHAVLLCAQIPLQYVVANAGSGVLANVAVVNKLSDGLLTEDGNDAVELEVGTLRGGQSRSFDVTTRASAIGTYRSRATATANDGSTAHSNVTATSVRRPVLTLTKTGPGKQVLGEAVEYKITIANEGDAVAARTVIKDSVPKGAEFVTASEGGTLSGDQVVWDLGSLQVTASETFTVTYKPTVGGLITSGATAEGLCADTVRTSASTIVN